MGVKRTGGMSSKISRLTSAIRRELSKAVYEIADQVANDAAISIMAGSVEGENHKPSAPGTPPNNASQGLARNIRTMKVTDLTAQVVSDLPYSAIQELGGTINHPGGTPFFIKDGELVFVSKDSPAAARLPKTKPHLITLPERPYLRPAAQKNKEPGKRRMHEAVDHVLKGGKFS